MGYTSQDWGYVLITVGTFLLVAVLLTTFVIMIIWAVRTPKVVEVPTVVVRAPTPVRHYQARHGAPVRPPMIQLHPHAPLPKPADPWLRSALTEVRD